LTWVDIDADKRRARCGSGAIWIDVAEPASRGGLAALAGSSPDVGIAGYTVGGGIGWLSRRYGLATNSVVALEIVTADGEVRKVDHTNDAELFLALRGGGGSFGIVTALEFQLYAVPELYAGWLIWPMDQAREVLNTWRTWVRSVPDEGTSFGRLLRVPPMDNIPPELRGREGAPPVARSAA
jgi:FAD/FMN-containing dehydrogenase